MTTETAEPPVTRRQRSAGHGRRSGGRAVYWAYLIPGALLFLGVIVVPFVMNLYLSFTKWPGLGTPRWIGLHNYTRLFADETFWLSFRNSVAMIVAMVVLGGIGHLPGVILGAVLLSALPEVLRYVASPLQAMTGGRLDAAILRQLLIALAMISVMLLRPRGLWPAPTHGKSLQNSKPPAPGTPGSSALN